MAKDTIAEEISWLDGIITHPENRNLFMDENQLEILGELSTRWVKENRLDLLNDLSAKYEEESIFAVIDRIINSNCKRDWEQAGKESHNSLDAFIARLWEPLKESGFEFTYRQEGNSTSFCVTQCPMAELARKIGGEKWLYHLVCLTDEPSITGFNKDIHFSRTRTLMQGYPDCDHTYTDQSR